MTSLWQADHRSVAGSAFAPGARREVVVVGAGITGLSTALMLARDGHEVTVLEAGEVAQLATGSNTGKVSLLQGVRLSRIRAHHAADLVRAYVEANRAGQEWLLGFLDGAGVPHTRHTAYSYAQSDEGERTVQDELAAASEAGLPVRLAARDELDGLPFPARHAVALDGQTAVDPDAVASALAEAFLAAGGILHTGVRVTRAAARPQPHVETAQGLMFAEHIVLATGTPIADRGLYFAKVSGTRSYCVSFRTDADIPEGLFLSVDQPSRSIRPVSASDGAAAGARLVVGGNGHPVGREMSEQEQYDDLIAWTARYFPGAEPTHRWSAQDYESHNLVPFAGVMPRSLGRVRFATGYAKWGLTNGPAAALRLSSEIRGDRISAKPRWMTMLGTRLTVPADIGRGLTENARVAGAAARGWWEAERTPVPVARPAEGEGVVANRGGAPVAVSTVDGRTRAVSAVCTHLGGVLSWNDAECTWDCPLHASRFAPDGTRIEGPAVRDLAPISAPRDR